MEKQKNNALEKAENAVKANGEQTSAGESGVKPVVKEHAVKKHAAKTGAKQKKTSAAGKENGKGLRPAAALSG